MSDFVYRDEDGTAHSFRFLGWKENGLAFYATEANGRPAVMTPCTAYPEDSNTGQPFRFPRVVPSEIAPYQFRIAWTDKHREVLRQWRDAKLAEAEGYTAKALFPWDVLKDPQPASTPQEIESARKQERQGIEERYKVLAETPLVELLDWILYPYVLDEFRSGTWANEMGKDFKTMLCVANEFAARWHRAYDAAAEHWFPQRMLADLRRVRSIMRASNGEAFHLRRIEVRLPTDSEAKAYALLLQLLGGGSAPHRRQINSGAGSAVQVDHVLAEIKSDVKELRDIERGRKKAWRAKGGAATLKLGQCPREAQALKNYIRRRAASLGGRGMTRAVREGRQWFKTKFPDLSHIVEGMHDNSLRNFVTGKTGRRPKGNSKR